MRLIVLLTLLLVECAGVYALNNRIQIYDAYEIDSTSDTALHADYDGKPWQNVVTGELK